MMTVKEMKDRLEELKVRDDAEIYVAVPEGFEEDFDTIEYDPKRKIVYFSQGLTISNSYAIILIETRKGSVRNDRSNLNNYVSVL